MTGLTTGTTILKGNVLSEMDAEDLLQLDVNCIDEVIDFVPMPSGFYRFSTKECDEVEVGDDKDKVIKVVYSLTSCEELTYPENEEDAEVVSTSFADGATVEHSENYYLKSNGKSAYGIRAFATIFKSLVPAGQKANVIELMEMSIGSSGICLIEKRTFTPKGQTESRTSSKVKPTGVAFD